jgi:hypothetical protein
LAAAAEVAEQQARAAAGLALVKAEREMAVAAAVAAAAAADRPVHSVGSDDQSSEGGAGAAAHDRLMRAARAWEDEAEREWVTEEEGEAASVEADEMPAAGMPSSHRATAAARRRRASGEHRPLPPSTLQLTDAVPEGTPSVIMTRPPDAATTATTALGSSPASVELGRKQAQLLELLRDGGERGSASYHQRLMALLRDVEELDAAAAQGMLVPVPPPPPPPPPPQEQEQEQEQQEEAAADTAARTRQESVATDATPGEISISALEALSRVRLLAEQPCPTPTTPLQQQRWQQRQPSIYGTPSTPSAEAMVPYRSSVLEEYRQFIQSEMPDAELVGNRQEESVNTVETQINDLLAKRTSPAFSDAIHVNSVSRPQERAASQQRMDGTGPPPLPTAVREPWPEPATTSTTRPQLAQQPVAPVAAVAAPHAVAPSGGVPAEPSGSLTAAASAAPEGGQQQQEEHDSQSQQDRQDRQMQVLLAESGGILVREGAQSPRWHVTSPEAGKLSFQLIS